MDKNILIMCTGNSCRSIIGEALINKEFNNIKAYSCGVKPSGTVNPHAKKVLQFHDAWENNYHSKHLDEVIEIDFDLVVTVCDNAKETCPMFPKHTKTIHVGFVDPDGKGFSAFEETYMLIKDKLLTKVKEQI